MAGLRPFVEDDIPTVANLVWKILHTRIGSAPITLQDYLGDLFFHNPWRDEGIVSRVYEDGQGKIVGFFGAVARRMSISGKSVKLAFGSNFVVNPESRTTMAAIQLVKAFMGGAQNISITDSATDGSRQLLRSLGFSVVPIYSLQWARPLRPARYATYAVSRFLKRKSVTRVAQMATPFCGIADYVSSLRFSPFRQTEPPTTCENLDTDTLLECLNKIPPKHFLLPEYSRQSLEWILAFLAKQNARDEVHKVLVRDQDGKIIGWYVYSLQPDGIGEVWQIGAASFAVNKVLDSMFYDAWKNRLLGLHGRLEPSFMQELTMKACFFYRQGSWALANSKQPELLALLHSGTAFFSRLDGESCLRYTATDV